MSPTTASRNGTSRPQVQKSNQAPLPARPPVRILRILDAQDVTTVVVAAAQGGGSGRQRLGLVDRRVRVKIGVAEIDRRIPRGLPLTADAQPDAVIVGTRAERSEFVVGVRS